MASLRVFWRMIAVTLSTFFHYIFILLVYTLIPFGYDPRGVATFLRHRWGLSLCRILNTTVTVHGPVPTPPFFLVSNHLSYSDVWVLFSVLRGTFIAKSDVKSWPVIGWMIATSGILFINRNSRMDVRRANDEISRSITEQQGVILFPEGTTSAGDTVLPFRSPLLQYPAVHDISVHTVAIRYQARDEGHTAREHICWWDDTPFATHFLRMLKLKGMHADLYFHTETINGEDRKELALRAEDRIRDMYLNSASQQFVAHK